MAAHAFGQFQFIAASDNGHSHNRLNGNVNGKRNGIAFATVTETATGNGPSTVPKLGQAQSEDRDSAIPAIPVYPWPCRVSACGGSGVGIDRLFNWLRCLPHPASSYPPRKQRRKWSDVDKAHLRQRRRLNCRTFYSRTYFKVCASATATASAPRRSYRSSCCLPAEVTIPLPLSRAAGHGHRQSQHKRCSGGLQIIFVMLSYTKIPNVW